MPRDEANRRILVFEGIQYKTNMRVFNGQYIRIYARCKLNVVGRVLLKT